MRHETCVTCKLSSDLTPLQRLATEFAEQLGADVHHHHAVSCGSCGRWWFDDVVLSPLGIPVPGRRDTVFCACHEDGRAVFIPSVVIVRVPESGCHCTVAEINRARAAS